MFYLGFSLDFMKKTGRFSSFFQTKFSTFNKIKTKTYIKNLRHYSVHMSVIYGYSKLCVSQLIITEISQFKNCKLKSSFFYSQPFN